MGMCALTGMTGDIVKDLTKAKKIVNEDNLDVFYWVDWRKEMKRDFIVMHPGSSVNHSAIEKHAAYLNDLGYPTLLVEPIGYGLSEACLLKPGASIRPQHFTTGKYCRTLERILHAEGIEKKRLWGHSHGFHVIAELASHGPENVSRIIGVCASDDFMKTAASTAFVRLFDSVLRYPVELSAHTAIRLSRFLRRQGTAYHDFAILEGRSDRAASIRSWLETIGTSYRGMILNTAHGHVADNSRISERTAASIRHIPAVVVYGRDDFMVSAEKAGPRMKRIFDNCRVLVIPGNHCLPINRPGELAMALSPYLI